jgi:hypothetical protein
MSKAEELRRAIEHAPQGAGPIADGLLGWRVDSGAGTDVFVCAECAGRIRGRGCTLGRATPIWLDEPLIVYDAHKGSWDNRAKCCTCGFLLAQSD